MSFTQPQFNLPTSGGTTDLEVVTTIQDHVWTGTLDNTTVDVQVSLNGAPFQSDPSLIEFDQGVFTIPNRNVYPSGFPLEYGKQDIRIRAVAPTGSVSPISQVTATRLRSTDFVSSTAPSALRVRRYQDRVGIAFAAVDIPGVTHYNVYVATTQGGGAQGYVKLNRDPISTVAFQEEVLTTLPENTTASSGSRSLFVNNRYGQIGVTVDQRDFQDQVLVVETQQNIDSSFGAAQLKVNINVENVVVTDFYEFIHDRADLSNTINADVFAGLESTEPLFYVTTTVVYDPQTNTSVESAYSPELIGLPLPIDTQVRALPRRTRFDVSEAYIDAILAIDSGISVIPGSVVRDIFIDPFSTEAERLYFVMDFVSRTSSFSTLLTLDALPSYKQALAAALGVSEARDIQVVIDDSFDKLAQNVQVQRQGANFAIGEVLFYTTVEPTQDIVIDAGVTVGTNDGVTFVTTATTTLPLSSLSSYFNPQERRWEVVVPIQAEDQGAQGNVGVASITQSFGGVGNLQVTNVESTRFGRDDESNADLAARSILAFSSVDAGTSAGYLATTVRQQGVFRALVIDAGHPYMARDYDPIRAKHIGGKVDVWVQGRISRTFTDTFALSFAVERDIRFFLDSDPQDLIFIADDPRLTPTTGLVQMLGATPSEQAQGFGFRNATTGALFDLTNVTILDHNRIQLSTAIPQPPVAPNDIVRGDYRFRDSDSFVLPRQPVSSVNSVESLASNVVLQQGVHYTLTQTDDPLLNGRSKLATDQMVITPTNGVPSGASQIVNAEEHVLLGSQAVNLTNFGVYQNTIRVFSLDRLTEYYSNTTTPDFFVTRGSDTSPTQITRNPAGTIVDGTLVSIDYEHDENFVVSYVVNEVITNVQNALEIQRHVTADVLVKEAIPNPIDLEMTITLAKNTTKAVVDPLVRTQVSSFLNGLGIGDPVHQSDIVRVIENTEGVSYVVLPFERLAQAAGNTILREGLATSFLILETSATVKIYIAQDALDYPTSDGAGPSYLHKGVFKDGIVIPMVTSLNSLRASTEISSMVVGYQGIIIQGYSDDTTLANDGYTTAEEQEARRLELTANKVLLAVKPSQSPENYAWEVTYIVATSEPRLSQSQSSIPVVSPSYPELGALTITYTNEA